jgi:hypothetical protein
MEKDDKVKAKKAGAKRAPSAWNLHVAEVRKKNPGKSLKDILVLAKSSYKK